MAQPLHAQPRVDPLGLDDLIEEKLDVLVLLANAVGNPLTLLVAILPKVSRRCGGAAEQALATLTEVDLHPFHERLTYAAVAAIAAGCPRITSLNLYGCERITDAAVAAVAANYLRRQHHRRGQSSQRAVKAARAGYSQLQIHILPAGARGILGPRVGVLWVRVSGVLSGESV